MARPRWQTGWLLKIGKRRPVWVGRFREDALANDGSRVRRQISVRLGLVSEIGKRQAERLLSERLSAINQGRHKPELLTAFEQFVAERWEPNIYPTLRFSTSRNYRCLVRRHLLPFFGDVRLTDIAPADVQKFIAEKAKRFAPKTVLSLRNLLSKILGTAQQWGYLQSNSAKGTQVPALVMTRERLTLTPEQVRVLLSELSEPYRTMVLLAVLSGLRRGEILGLRWKCVDWLQGSIRVAETSYEGHSAPPKTRASLRMVFIDSTVLDALKQIKPENYQGDDFVFRSVRGTSLDPNHILKRVFHPACKRADVPHVGFHSFRYTYSTWANPTGESIKALQAQLGHTDSRLTLSVYTQPQPTAQRQLASKIARVLLPIAPKSDDESKGLIGLIQ